MMNFFKPLVQALLIVSCLINTSFADSIQQVKNSVIKIYTTAAAPNYLAPWQLLNPRQFSGSGTVISKNRILTNAHVVADAKYIQVQKNSSSEKYIAEVSFISHAADLAILKVHDKSFFSDLKALEIASLPELYQEVSVFGYPIGGESLSVTKGIMSRVEQQIYAHSQNFLLAGQIDAAINPGNSGGPVIMNQKIVGVVMQAYASPMTMNLGYFIPPSIIQHVLKDSEDAKYDGFPRLGFITQNLENPAAKSAYGLTKKQSGVLVIKTFEQGAAAGKLKKNDVILKIDQYSIAGNSTVNYGKNLKSHYKHAIDLHHVGDQVNITYIREGKVQTTDLIAQKKQHGFSLIKPPVYEEIPKYYVYGGIVFVPLNMNFLIHLGAAGASNSTSKWVSEEKQELVSILQILAADVNLGYQYFRSRVIESVNGESVKNFAHFVELLEKNTAKNIIFEDEIGYQIIMNHQQALASEKDILKLYSIPKKYSKGLLDNQNFKASK